VKYEFKHGVILPPLGVGGSQKLVKNARKCFVKIELENVV
jgi:hypothetical protein